MRFISVVMGLSLFAHAGCAGEPALEGSLLQEAACRPGPVETLADAAERAGRLVGAAVAHDPLLGEPVYRDLLAQEFNYVTPENETKWEPLQPASPDTWTFDRADAIVAAADEADQEVKGHAVLWHNQLPPFVNDALTPAQLRRYLEQHTEKVMRRYKRDIRAWDVVNEAIDDDAGLRDTVFLRLLGPGYIARAFRAAHRADPGAKLYYNDYNIDAENAKSDAVYALVSSLLAERVPIHGVGFQMHLEAASAPSAEAMAANFQRFADLGLRVNVSELDVRVAQLPGDLATKLAVQKQVYHRVVAACMQVARCEGITTWGFTDRHSWIDGFFGPDDPLLFDDDYRRKPAYYAMVDGFLNVPPDPPGAAPNLIANSAFEVGADGWTAFGAVIDRTEEQARTGASSARVTARTATFQGPVIDLRAVVQPGRGYDVSAWARISAPTDSVRLTAKSRCAGGADQFTTLDADLATDADWVELSGQLAVPTCTLEELVVYVEGPAAGVTVYADDVAVRPQPGDGGPNLIANPGFELGPSGWFAFAGGSLAATANQAHSGTRSGVVTDRTASFQGPGLNLVPGTAPETAYAVSAWGRLGGAPTDALFITAKTVCADGTTSFSRVATGSGTDTGWSLLTGSIVTPACPLTELTLYLEGPAAGVDIYVDDVSVSEILD